ncbi:hypothetical protein PsorP6_014035 [Peronosclerospora sorghi]|uniref:Uncharacterized protein n=1 Tax=Peronosclerospora sorghi TaxID=230839 RepID=A0ACC0VHS8_9STRA|nr:hypothetical protein PsorP6_014035 [Peronosclerospora sorghi]
MGVNSDYDVPPDRGHEAETLNDGAHEHEHHHRELYPRVLPLTRDLFHLVRHVVLDQTYWKPGFSSFRSYTMFWYLARCHFSTSKRFLRVQHTRNDEPPRCRGRGARALHVLPPHGRRRHETKREVVHEARERERHQGFFVNVHERKEEPPKVSELPNQR